MRKTYLIIIVIIFLIALGVGLIVIFRKKEIPLITKEVERIFSEPILTEQVFFPFYCKNENSFYYLTEGNKIKSFDLTSKSEKETTNFLSDKDLTIVGISWFSDCSKAIIEKAEDEVGYLSSFLIFEFSNNNLIKLNKNALNPTWSLGGNKIAYAEIQEENKSLLKIADSKGKNPNQIVELPGIRYKFLWIDDKNILAYYVPFEEEENKEVLLIDLQKESKKGLGIKTNAASLSPNSNYLAYENWENGTRTIGIYGLGSRQSLNTNLNTIIEKVTWSDNSNNLYLTIKDKKTNREQIFKVAVPSMEKSNIFQFRSTDFIEIQKLFVVGSDQFYALFEDKLFKLNI